MVPEVELKGREDFPLAAHFFYARVIVQQMAQDTLTHGCTICCRQDSQEH